MTHVWNPFTQRYAPCPALDAPDDEPMRCELDHRTGGVCLRRLRWDGSCPGEDDHWVEPDESAEAAR